jgi:SAM-dependent methyltransferase
MKNIERWHQTKFVSTACGLRASRDRKQVSIGSRFITDIVAQRYERTIRAHARGRLLDMGCGYVPLYGVYRDLVQENICIDWESTFHPGIHLDFVVDLNGRLPFEDGSFNTILLTDVLEHIAEPTLLVSEIARLLQFNGKLILGVPFFYWLHEVPHDYYRYTEHSLRRFCNHNHLKVIELEPYGGLPEILVDLTSKGISYLPRPLAACLRIAFSPVAALSKTDTCRRLSRLTQCDFPLGYVLVAQKAASYV